MTTMTSLQIQSFASLIDQLPIGVEESERIDRAANAACSSGSEDGSSDRVHEISDGRNSVPARDSSKSSCQDCRQSHGGVGCSADEALSGRQAYGGCSDFSGISFSPVGEDAACLQVPERSSATLAPGGCTVQSGVADGAFHSVTCSISRDSAAQHHPSSGLRSFSAQEACTVVDPMQGFLSYSPEEASVRFSSAATPPDYSNSDAAPTSAHSGGKNLFPTDQGCVGSGWNSWAHGCTAGPESKYGAHASRSFGERLSGQHPHSVRGSLASHATHGIYSGGQVQVSIVSPGERERETATWTESMARKLLLAPWRLERRQEKYTRIIRLLWEDVVVTSYGCSDWTGCCNGCQVEVTRVSRPSSPRPLSPARSRQTGSPANIKVKSVSPSGPDQFVLCLEGESGQEQHVSIDRQDLLLVATPQVQALAEEERMTKGAAGTKQGNSHFANSGSQHFGSSDNEDGGQAPRYAGDSFLGVSGEGRCEKWNQEVRRWQSQFCRELELQRKRLLLREEACRKREEEFRLREDEARRQKMTIAALEGEVLKVTEEMQEMLLQKEEGRLIVQREFLERKGRYVSRLQDLRPFLGIYFEDVLRGLTNCRTIGQLSTWSSIFDATEDMPPKMAAQHIIEVLKSGITAPLFVSTPAIPASTNVVGVALDILSRPGHIGNQVRYTARAPLTDQCILRIPSLTNDSHVRVDENVELTPENAMIGSGTCTSRICSMDDQRFFHHVHVGEAILSRCRQPGPVEDQQSRDTARGLRAGALWGGGGIDSVSLSLGSPTLDAASMKDIMNGGSQYSVHAGQVILPSSAATELTMDGIYLRPICSRLPSRTTSICGDHESCHADWAPCRIDSRHAEEALDTHGNDGCGSWMERVAYANGGGCLSISFFNAASRTHRAPSPICG